MITNSFLRMSLSSSRPLSILSSASTPPGSQDPNISPPSRRGGIFANHAKSIIKDNRYNAFSNANAIIKIGRNNKIFDYKLKTILVDSSHVVCYSSDVKEGESGQKKNLEGGNDDVKEDIKEVNIDDSNMDIKVSNSEDDDGEVKSEGKDLSKIKEDWEEEGVKCEHCGIGFTTEEALSKHIELTGTKGGGGCKALWKMKNKADVEAGILKHVCDFDGCDIGFKWKSELEKHKASHSDERPFTCSECGSSYKLQQNLNKHVREKHAGQVFECPECDKTFNQESAMKTHLKVCRQEEKEFKCSQCGVKFYTNSDLTQHIKSVHNKERPHKCELCDYSCSTKTHLKRHMLSVHENAKPHQCEDCSAAFSTARHLKTHRIRHHTFDWPHICHVCEKEGIMKGYIAAGGLEKHMKKQHPVEYQEQFPAVCPQCGKRFKSAKQVEIHVRKNHVSEFESNSVK